MYVCPIILRFWLLAKKTPLRWNFEKKICAKIFACECMNNFSDTLMEFLNNQWRNLNLSGHVLACSPGTQRKVDTIANIWNFFAVNQLQNFVGMPGVEEIVAYMMYRVATVLPNDPFAGRISLSTFSNTELNCLIRGFQQCFGEEFRVTKQMVRDSVLYRNAFKAISVRFGEQIKSVHARPIWFQDEQRLLWSTSVCTAGLRDRALIRVMVSTGGRVHDISLLHKQQHVEEKLDHAGEPAIMVLMLLTWCTVGHQRQRNSPNP